MRSITLAMVIAVLVTRPAYADDWVDLGISKDGSQTLIDGTTVSLANGTISAWLKQFPATPRTNGTVYLMTQIEIRCAARQMRITSSTGYKENGTVSTPTDDAEVPFTPIIPETLTAALHKGLCAKFSN